MAEAQNMITVDAGDINSGNMLEMTPELTLTPDTLITVPIGYKAELIVDGVHVATQRACQKKKLIRILGAGAEGKTFSALFVKKRRFSNISWGIGSLTIRYEFLEGFFLNVGASGTLSAEITKPVEFYRSLGLNGAGRIGVNECTSIIVSTFRVLASKILSGMFTEASQPIFETDFLVDEMHRRLAFEVCGQDDAVSAPGVTPGILFSSAEVGAICVNETDKQRFIARFGVKRRR